MSIGLVVALVAAPAAQAATAESSDPVPGFNGTVLAVAYAGNTVFIGGDFTAAVVKGKTVTRTRLAAVNASTGELLPWAPTANARVKAIAVDGSAVYLGGDFTKINGSGRDSLARVDAASGALSSSFKHSVDGKPYALAAANGRLYVGGTLAKVDGQTRTRLAAFSLSSGALDGSWKPSADDQVEALAAGSDRIYAGGKFHKVDSTSGYDRLVALDPASGKIVTGFKPKPSVIAFAIAVTGDSVYTANGGQGGTANAYTLSGGKRWTATFDGDAQAITSLGDTVYVGGHFDHACRTARTGAQGVCLDGQDDRVKLAALAASDGRLKSWKADANGVVGVLTMTANPQLGAFAAGGAFTTINGAAQKRFAQFR
ncbi:PQQ-like beta-propeller repeat protein [Actinoplanes sp. N902-109]|uniref:PQQ-like beta-propeller repeat protein n=1 Tax=Actinoplanes sp. (strain N902-109) TaxID=649831 RepID=UPI001E3815F2|nr:PQQ-like beta-propeller repeat protein [Actinoplanes sp. N902-109]